MYPWYFGTGPDPRICTTTLQVRNRIRLWIWILLFSSVADIKPELFAFYFLKVHQSSKSKKKSQYRGKSMFFFLFFVCWWKDPDPYRNYGSGSGRPKNKRIHIHQHCLLLCRTSMHIFFSFWHGFWSFWFRIRIPPSLWYASISTVDPDPHLESWEGKGCTGTLYTV